MFAETSVALPPVPDAELAIFDIAAALGTDDAPDVLERYVRSILVAWGPAPRGHRGMGPTVQSVAFSRSRVGIGGNGPSVITPRRWKRSTSSVISTIAVSPSYSPTPSKVVVMTG